MIKKYKVGVLGCAHIAIRSLLPAFSSSERFELTGIASRDFHKAQLAAAPYHCVAYGSYEELLDNEDIELVYIPLPTGLHYEWIHKALEKGKHVMSEKSLSCTYDEVRELVELACDKHLLLIENFQFRFHSQHVWVKELLESGELGQMKRVIWIITDWYRSQSYYDQGGWRATWDGEGGGVLLNQNPHNLDLWQWICGMPKRVKSEVYYGKHRNIEVEDDVTAFVEYENGAVGCYITTIGDAPGTNRLEIDGERGKIVIEDGKLKFWRLRVPEPEFNATYKKGLGKPEVWECEVPVKGTYTSHPGIINNFAEAIRKGVMPIAPGTEGIKGLQISNGIHLSSWLGGQWIDLPVDENLFLEKLQEHCKETVIF